MEEETRRDVIYSEYGVPYYKGLAGLFSPVQDSPEDEILRAVIMGSKYQTRHVVAIGFSWINGQIALPRLPIDELYLPARGAVESVDARHEENYKRLKRLSAKTDRLSHHLDPKEDPQIFALLPVAGAKGQNKRPFPHYIHLDDDRVLALYIVKEPNQKE